MAALDFYKGSKAFDEKEKAVLLHAERVTRAASTSRGTTLDELRKHFGDGEIVELTLVICLANFTNRFNDALLTEPDLG